MAYCRFIQAPLPKQFLDFRKYDEKSFKKSRCYKNKTLLGDFTMNSEDKTFYRYFQS